MGIWDQRVRAPPSRIDEAGRRPAAVLTAPPAPHKPNIKHIRNSPPQSVSTCGPLPAVATNRWTLTFFLSSRNPRPCLRTVSVCVDAVIPVRRACRPNGHEAGTPLGSGRLTTRRTVSAICRWPSSDRCRPSSVPRAEPITSDRMRLGIRATSNSDASRR